MTLFLEDYLPSIIGCFKIYHVHTSKAMISDLRYVDRHAYICDQIMTYITTTLYNLINVNLPEL